jgi:hypothetical protein
MQANKQTTTTRNPYKTTRENRRNLSDLAFGDKFLDITPKATICKRKD